MNKIIKIEFIGDWHGKYQVGDEILIKRHETIEKIEFIAPNTALYMPANYDFGVYCVFTKEGHIISLPAINYSATWENDSEATYF